MTTATGKAGHKPDLPLRHALATLVYRAAKTLRDAPADFSSFRPGKESARRARSSPICAT